MEGLPKPGFTDRMPSGWLFCGQELVYNLTYSHLDHSDAFRVRVYYPNETVLGPFRSIFAPEYDHRKITLGICHIYILEGEVFLDSLCVYANSPSWKDLVPESERQQLKGFGKYMAAFALNYLKRKDLIKDTWSIELDAANDCETGMEITQYQIRDCLKAYPMVFQIQCGTYDYSGDCKIVTCKILSTAKLVDYYSRNFGMELIENEGLIASMKGSVGKVLAALNK